MPARKTTTRTKTSSTSRTKARSSAAQKTAPRKSAASGSVASRKTARKVAGKRPASSAHKSATKKPAVKAPAKSATKSAARSATPAEQLREYQRKRDFTKTAEPAGARGSKSAARKVGELRFVIQKHEATRLHYDLRLEIDGVMKSWAVPKGPSADPSVKRLAMQVEDHPVEYNSFEGTIPKGEYGGGTVMIWDTGTYTVEGAGDRSQNAAAHDEYAKGELKVSFHGKRIRGSYALVRTRGQMRGGGNPDKPAWLLIKHRDGDARPEADFDLTGEYTTSAVTRRTMEGIRERGPVYGE
jgi:bifunctional non-homologous end joining protein LigD